MESLYKLRASFRNYNKINYSVFSKRASPFSWAGPIRLILPSIPLEELPAIDVITVSLNHYDHLDLASFNYLSAEIKFIFIDTIYISFFLYQKIKLNIKNIHK